MYHGNDFIILRFSYYIIFLYLNFFNCFSAINKTKNFHLLKICLLKTFYSLNYYLVCVHQLPNTQSIDPGLWTGLAVLTQCLLAFVYVVNKYFCLNH